MVERFIITESGDFIAHHSTLGVAWDRLGILKRLLWKEKDEGMGYGGRWEVAWKHWHFKFDVKQANIAKVGQTQRDIKSEKTTSLVGLQMELNWTLYSSYFSIFASKAKAPRKYTYTYRTQNFTHSSKNRNEFFLLAGRDRKNQKIKNK